MYTPVGIYLRLRDRFRDTILLESADFHAGENSFSFIGINAIGGIEIRNLNEIEYKFPLHEAKKMSIISSVKVTEEIWNFIDRGFGGRSFCVGGDVENQGRDWRRTIGPYHHG